MSPNGKEILSNNDGKPVAVSFSNELLRSIETSGWLMRTPDGFPQLRVVSAVSDPDRPGSVLYKYIIARFFDWEKDCFEIIDNLSKFGMGYPPRP